MPGEISDTVPRFTQFVNGSVRFVVPSTVKVVPGVLVKVNWNAPLPSSCALVNCGGVTVTCVFWVTEMDSPSSPMCAVRCEPVLAVKE